MQTTIAQAAALTIHGNALLRGAGVESFWPGGTVFGFCRTVSFLALSDGGSAAAEIPYADNPIDWYGRLRDEKVRGLRLHHLSGTNQDFSDRMSVGFVGGGGTWVIEAVGDKEAHGWVGRWQVGNQQDPERRIWNVAYLRMPGVQKPAELPDPDHERLTADLAALLEETATFADRQQLTGFARCFRTGIHLLQSQAPLEEVYHSDIAPPEAVPLWSRQLLAVAQEAWVFGGMGSWNDLSFEGEDKPRYEELSDRLFGLLNRAILVATNASFKQPL